RVKAPISATDRREPADQTLGAHGPVRNAKHGIGHPRVQHANLHFANDQYEACSRSRDSQCRQTENSSHSAVSFLMIQRITKCPTRTETIAYASSLFPSGSVNS